MDLTKIPMLTFGEALAGAAIIVVLVLAIQWIAKGWGVR